METRTPTQTNILAQAARRGATAYQDGFNRIPNRSVINLIKNNENMRSEILAAWLSGWDRANLDQPVPFMETESAD